MASRWFTYISELAEQTQKEVTHSPQNWRRFLTTASRFYKSYDFDDQLLIYAQRPNAIACAEIEVWNNKMHRWVNAGSTAIGLIRKGTGGKPYIQNVHDVADTHPVRGGKNPWLWKMDEEYQTKVVARLAEQFGSPEGASLGDAIMEAVSRVVDENYGEYLRDLHYEVADSFLEELDELNREVLFRNTMKASVQYAALTRCGLDASQYIDDEDLIGITNFNNVGTLACLGTATAEANRIVLLEIGETIRAAQLEQARNLTQNPLAKQPEVSYNVDEQFNTLKREGAATMSELTYTNQNGYQIPNLMVDSKENEPETLTRFGRTREKYLMEHRKGFYTAMLLKGTLWTHLTQIDQTANEQMDALTAELAAREGVTEKLKADNQMEWVQRMNNIRQRAEEIVMADLIYS